MRSTLEEVSAYMRDELDAPVYAAVPASRPPFFVVIDPIGGSAEGEAVHPEYAVQAWGRKDADAEGLLRGACDAMRDYGAEIESLPARMGRDATHVMWRASFVVHSLY